MTLSELIATLQALQAEHGDLDVLYEFDCIYCSVTSPHVATIELKKLGYALGKVVVL